MLRLLIYTMMVFEFCVLSFACSSPAGGKHFGVSGLLLFLLLLWYYADSHFYVYPIFPCKFCLVPLLPETG